jgi:hypothetical protein
VLFCEKSDRVGSTNNDAKRYLEAVIGAAPDQRRDIYLETGYPAPWLSGESPGRYDRRPTLRSSTFDERLLGANFELVRPPIGEFMALGGMMIGRDDITSRGFFWPEARAGAGMRAASRSRACRVELASLLGWFCW